MGLALCKVARQRSLDFPASSYKFTSSTENASSKPLDLARSLVSLPPASHRPLFPIGQLHSLNRPSHCLDEAIGATNQDHGASRGRKSEKNTYYMSNMFNMSQVTFLSWGNLVEGVWHRDMQTYIACFFRVRSTVLCFANWQLPFLGSLRCFFDSLGCDVACNRAKHLPPSSSCRHMQTDLPTSSQLGTHSMKPFMALPYNILEPFVRPATGQATQEALKY